MDDDDDGRLRLLALLGRARRLVLLASEGFAEVAASLVSVLEARRCLVYAGIEGCVHGYEDLATNTGVGTNSFFDAVVVLGANPASPAAFLEGGALQVAAMAAVKAISEKTLVYTITNAVCSKSTSRYVIHGGPAIVNTLVNDLKQEPEDEPLGAEQRWAIAACACEADDAATLKRCLDQWPELRAARNTESQPLLCLAAEAGAAKVCAVLLQLGASVSLVDARGRTPGDAAFLSGSQSVFDMLVEFDCNASRTEQQVAAKDCGETMQHGEHVGSSPKRRRREEHDGYLKQQLVYKNGELLDAEGNGIMMGWEAPLMQRHAEALLPEDGASVLNVGFGLGLVDGYFQARRPASHHIIEAHPDVWKEIRRQGWSERLGVIVHEGRWQDVICNLPDQSFDAIFFDTWKETYVEVREFFEHVPRLLRAGGRFSYFNGLAPYSIFHHAVFCRMAQEDFACLGLQCGFLPVQLGSLNDEVWLDVAHVYWQFETYYLPLAQRKEDDKTSQLAVIAELTGRDALPTLAIEEDAVVSGRMDSKPTVFDNSMWRKHPSPIVRVEDQLGEKPFAAPEVWGASES